MASSEKMSAQDMIMIEVSALRYNIICAFVVMYGEKYISTVKCVFYTLSFFSFNDCLISQSAHILGGKHAD